MEDQLFTTPIVNGNADPGPQRILAHEQTTLGPPVTFLIGPLIGRTVRARLQEIQQADVGRKFLKRDRRPLDPPPCCLLTLYDVLDFGTEQERMEEIVNYDDILPEGWVCNVEMFTSFTSSEQTVPSATSSNKHTTETPAVDTAPTFEPIPDPDLGNNLTSALAGSTFVQAIKSLVDGRRVILFLFPDLSCRLEGSFRLRYRVFNAMCIASGADQRPIMASCLGGAFTVYNSRTFPGLNEPTALTRSLSTVGVHPNNRESIRRGGSRRRREDPGQNSSPSHVSVHESQNATFPSGH